MTPPPQFNSPDPLDPHGLPAAEEEPASRESDDAFGGLEGVLFSPYLTADDLAGETWDAAGAVPEFPAGGWKNAKPPVQQARQAAAPKAQPPRAEPEEPLVAWIEPPERVEKILSSAGAKPGNQAEAKTASDIPAVDWMSTGSSQLIEDEDEPESENGKPPAPPVESIHSMDEALFTPLSTGEIAVIPEDSGEAHRLLIVAPEAASANGAPTISPASAQKGAGPDLTEAPVFAPPWEHGTNSDEMGPARLSAVEETKAPQEAKVAAAMPITLQEGLTEIVEAPIIRNEDAKVTAQTEAPPPPDLAEEKGGDQSPSPAIIQEVPSEADGSASSPLFQSFYNSAPPAPARIPNFAHTSLLAIFAVLGSIGALLIGRLALNFHLFGVDSLQQASSDVHYTIGSMVVFYLITFGAAMLLFPIIWERGFFAGLQWNGPAALRNFWPLMGAACVCFVLAMLDEILLPGPTNAPIDQLFDNRTAAWLLFAFGISFAPFFEEMIFRGFLLPTLCTAFDWTVEQAMGIPPRPLGHRGHPQWSLASMIIASICTSVPFALMHAEQTAWSLGPFLLLVAVSMVLCWARLSTRSLAASVLVHALYNFLLFSLMLYGTSGFRHMDKM